MASAGTKAAFEKFWAAEYPQLVGLPFRDETYSAWCLALSAKSPISGSYIGYLTQVELGALAFVNVKVPEETQFALVFLKGDQTITENRGQQWAEHPRAGELYTSVLDYSDVKDADTLCVVFESGWVVKDRAGQSYPASCDRFIPALSTSNGSVLEYNVAKQ